MHALVLKIKDVEQSIKETGWNYKISKEFEKEIGY